ARAPWRWVAPRRRLDLAVVRRRPLARGMPHRPSARCKNRDRLYAFFFRLAIATAPMRTPARSPLTPPPPHSAFFRVRPSIYWFPCGLTYAFLYMGRYNLTVAKNALGALMTNEDFGIIFGVGTVVYGVAFVANGPLTDKLGGRRALLVSAFGCAAVNSAMGPYLDRVLAAGTVNGASLRFWFCVLYAANMYFQSFGAVSVVKVNTHWFHVRERGGFGGIFGTMIASGIFMAFTVNSWILQFARSGSGAGSD